jgi:hypothetical protein
MEDHRERGRPRLDLLITVAALWIIGTVPAVFVWDSARHIVASLLRER